jgi:hypothetical protein
MNTSPNGSVVGNTGNGRRNPKRHRSGTPTSVMIPIQSQGTTNNAMSQAGSIGNTNYRSVLNNASSQGTGSSGYNTAMSRSSSVQRQNAFPVAGRQPPQGPQIKNPSSQGVQTRAQKAQAQAQAQAQKNLALAQEKIQSIQKTPNGNPILKRHRTGRTPGPSNQQPSRTQAQINNPISSAIRTLNGQTQGSQRSNNTRPGQAGNPNGTLNNTALSPLSKVEIQVIKDKIKDIIREKVERIYPGSGEAFSSFFDSNFIPLDYKNPFASSSKAQTASWSNAVSMDVVIPQDRLDLVKDYLVCQFADTYHDGKGSVEVYGRNVARGTRNTKSVRDAGHYINHLFDSWIKDAKPDGPDGFHTQDMIEALTYMKNTMSGFTNAGRKRGHESIERSEFYNLIVNNVYKKDEGRMPSSGWERKFLYGNDENEKGGVLGLIKEEFGKDKFVERKYCIQSSIKNLTTNVQDSHGIVIDMTQQAHGGARRIYGEWNMPKLLHISSLDDAGQGLLLENDWMKSVFHDFVEKMGLNKNLVSGCGGHGKHIIDFKPFSFRMFYKYNNMNIPILSVQIQVNQEKIESIKKRGDALCKVSINGMNDLSMSSKSGTFKITNNNMKRMSGGRNDWWHLQLMQKYIGDFLPIVYSFAKDSYYTTGDNMAIVQYLNMARLLKTSGITIQLKKKFNNNSKNNTNVLSQSAIKFKIIAEDGKEGLLRLFISPKRLREGN